MWYTRKGDGGTSGLFGTTTRLPKNHHIYEALGTVDELNSLIGLCRAIASEKIFGELIVNELKEVQECLFIVQAEIAGADKKISVEHVAKIESTIAHIEENVENPHGFVIAGSTTLSGLLDFARAVSRRAERMVVGISSEKSLGEETLSYMNRLSSLLYALARYASSKEGVTESSPMY